MLIRSWTFRNEIQFWLYDRARAADAWAELQKNIPATEKERASKMNSPERELTFSLGRALLRKHLAEILKANPLTLEILLTPSGKPFLASPSSPLTFSLSHSQNRILLALSPKGWIFGIDIELEQGQTDFALVAKRLFSEEDQKELAALSGKEKKEKFFDLWCLAEARFKMQGSSQKKDRYESSLIESLDENYHFALCYLEDRIAK
jgi:4'-phosphopantetheinyl transferase